MLRKIDEKPLNANVELSKIAEGVNLWKGQDNPWFYLQKGNLIWVERENHYDVYELTEAWDRSHPGSLHRCHLPRSKRLTVSSLPQVLGKVPNKSLIIPE